MNDLGPALRCAHVILGTDGAPDRWCGALPEWRIETWDEDNYLNPPILVCGAHRSEEIARACSGADRVKISRLEPDWFPASAQTDRFSDRERTT